MATLKNGERLTINGTSYEWRDDHYHLVSGGPTMTTIDAVTGAVETKPDGSVPFVGPVVGKITFGSNQGPPVEGTGQRPDGWLPGDATNPNIDRSAFEADQKRVLDKLRGERGLSPIQRTTSHHEFEGGCYESVGGKDRYQDGIAGNTPPVVDPREPVIWLAVDTAAVLAWDSQPALSRVNEYVRAGYRVVTVFVERPRTAIFVLELR